MQGKFITLEGGEGAGKSTQAATLAERLRSQGISVRLTREPGGSPKAEEIRNFWLQGGSTEKGWDGLTESLLVSAARRQHLVDTIWPALTAGEWIISDRFADSTFVYQGEGLGEDSANLNQLHKLIMGDFTPDLTLLLDLDPAISLQRIKGRTLQDRYEKQSIEFHQRLRAAFQARAKEFPERIKIIDASAGTEEVESGIWQQVSKLLGTCS